MLLVFRARAVGPSIGPIWGANCALEGLSGLAVIAGLSGLKQG